MPALAQARARSQQRSHQEPAQAEQAALGSAVGGASPSTMGNAMRLSMLQQGAGLSSAPLDAGIRGGVERVTGSDLGNARVHTGPEAQSIADAHGARALTAGNHIYAGQSGQNDHTLAHEAAHVAQQSAGGGATAQARPLQAGNAASVHEQQADQVASAALGDGDDSTGRYSVRPVSPTIQCEPKGGDTPPKDANPSTEKARFAIVQKVNAWYDTQVDRVEGYRAYLSANWNSYLHSTGGNYALSWGDNQAWNVISNLAGTAAGLLAPVAVGAIIGSSVAPGIGTAIGAIVGFVVSTVIAIIVTALGNKEAMATVDKTLKDVGGQMQSKLNEFNTQAATGRGNASKIRDFIITSATNPEHEAEDVKAWSDFVDGEKKILDGSPSPKGTALCDAMMKEWVLQHAGDEEDQNKETNETSWDTAREKYFGGDLDGIPNLFVKQTKYEWSKIGIAHQPYTDAAEAYIKDKKLNADDACKKYNGFTMYAYSTSNTEGFLNYITKNLPWYLELAEEGKQKIKKGEFKLKAGLDLTTADGTCYVNKWNYYFELTGELSWYLIRSSSFSVSPD
jgi:hypothetical protein